MHISYLDKLLGLCYFRQSVMYRGEVVRTGGGESRPADPISQSDKLKLYLVINMILCEIISAWNGMRVSENICSPFRELNERQ